MGGTPHGPGGGKEPPSSPPPSSCLSAARVTPPPPAAPSLTALPPCVTRCLPPSLPVLWCASGTVGRHPAQTTPSIHLVSMCCMSVFTTDMAFRAFSSTTCDSSERQRSTFGANTMARLLASILVCCTTSGWLNSCGHTRAEQVNRSVRNATAQTD